MSTSSLFTNIELLDSHVDRQVLDKTMEQQGGTATRRFFGLHGRVHGVLLSTTMSFYLKTCRMPGMSILHTVPPYAVPPRRVHSVSLHLPTFPLLSLLFDHCRTKLSPDRHDMADLPGVVSNVAAVQHGRYVYVTRIYFAHMLAFSIFARWLPAACWTDGRG